MSIPTSCIYGLHAVMALIQKAPKRVLALHVQSARQDKKIDEILAAAPTFVAVKKVSQADLDVLTQGATHQGIAALIKPAQALTDRELWSLLDELSVPPFLLVLDGVQDPHNLGACFRSADAAGVHAIIAPKDNAVGLTGTVAKVASGAMETVPFVQVTNLVRLLEKLKTLGIWIYGAAGEATQTLYQTDLTGPCALVLGAEGSGMRRLTREHCDVLIRIPMNGTVSSLNVSVATGICLFEAVRQRNPSQ